MPTMTPTSSAYRGPYAVLTQEECRLLLMLRMVHEAPEFQELMLKLETTQHPMMQALRTPSP